MWIKWHGYNNTRWNWWRLKAHPCTQGRIMQAIKKHPSERMEFLFAYYLTAISKFFCLWFFHWKYHFYVTYIFSIAVILDLPLSSFMIETLRCTMIYDIYLGPTLIMIISILWTTAYSILIITLIQSWVNQLWNVVLLVFT